MSLSSKALLLILTFAVTACGFEPIYGRRDEDSSAAALQQVKINLISDRIGQQLHNALLDRMNPRGRPKNPRYTLNINISSSKEQLGIQRDDTATRAKLTVIARYQLDSADGKLLSGTSRAVSGYNIVDSDYATQVAEQNAIDRNVRLISEDIRNRLALFLGSRAARQPS